MTLRQPGVSSATGSTTTTPLPRCWEWQSWAIPTNSSKSRPSPHSDNLTREVPRCSHSWTGGRPDAAVATPTPRRSGPRRTSASRMISPAGGPSIRVAHLEVPGARLRYEVSGVGPVLLLIPGAAADAAAFAGIAPSLRDRFTVVAYDPRGTC